MRGATDLPDHRRRRHRLRLRGGRLAHGPRARGRRRQRGADRGSGLAQALRPHGGQGGDPGRRDGDQGPRRRGGEALGRDADHRALGRAPGDRARRHDRPLQRLRRGGRRPRLRRRAARRSRSTRRSPSAAPPRASRTCPRPGRSPAIPTDELEAMGYKLVIFPSTQTWLFAKAYEELCQAVLRDRTTAAARRSLHELRRRQRAARARGVAVAMSARDVYDARGFGGRQGAGERPAVVVVDFIEGFTNPESALACDADAAVGATRQLLDAARAAGVPVHLHHGLLRRRRPRAGRDVHRQGARARDAAPGLALGRGRRAARAESGRAGAREALRVRVLRHAARRDAPRGGLRHGDRHRCVHLGLRAGDSRRRAPVRLPRARAARGRGGPGDRRPQRIAARHRREVRRRDLDRRGDRRRRGGGRRASRRADRERRHRHDRRVQRRARRLRRGGVGRDR